MTLIFTFLFLLYLIPLCKIVHLTIRRLFGLSSLTVWITSSHTKKDCGKRVLSWAGSFEYVLYPFRKYLIGFPLIVVVLAKIVLLGLHHPWFQFHSFFYFAFFALLQIWTTNAKHKTDLVAGEFLRICPRVHPQVFFRRYQCDLAFGGVDFFSDKELFFASPSGIDFKKNIHSSQPVLLFARVLIDTAYLIHLCLRVFQRLGPQYLHDIFDHTASLWGKRVLQLSRVRFLVTGKEKIQNQNGKFIFVFNHKSALDYVLSFFALSDVIVNQRSLNLRFILSQRFFGQRFVYHILGLGRLCRIMNMIFLDTRKPQQGHRDLAQAVSFLVNQDIDLAIFSQGRRAVVHYDRSLKRKDAGFYTTFQPQDDLSSPLAHLKKGTGYLVWDVLKEMHHQELECDLNLVFVGISGTATVMPKNSLRLQTETEVQFSVGDVLEISPNIMVQLDSEELSDKEKLQNKKRFVTDLNQTVSQKLQEVLGAHAILAQRYLTEVKGQLKFDDTRIALLRQYLCQVAQDDTIIFQILDCIYSLPVPRWNSYLSELSQFLLEKSHRGRLEDLLNEVSRELLQTV